MASNPSFFAKDEAVAVGSQAGTSRDRFGPMSRLLRVFFYLLYHPLAPTYDAVAAVVSIGRWNQWVEAAASFLEGKDILEVGFGPGHLQARLTEDPRLNVVGVDESRQMGALAHRRLRKKGRNRVQLTRGVAQMLPFDAQTFDTVVSTFPSEYIFDKRALSEVHRVLRETGRFVIIPAAWIIGKGLTDRGAAWLFRVTHQAPPSPRDILESQTMARLQEAGFDPDFEVVVLQKSQVFVIRARKVQPPVTSGAHKGAGYGLPGN